MSSDSERTIASAVSSATLSYLEGRVREEADAAASASSVEATVIHLRLATAYARRFGERSGRSISFAGESWIGEHRVW